ncbi:acyl-CoA thioesterase [Janibacter limosus]|uniref:acyl-CoA thioesterase n=1 Tax=Janibacter limosus TaxID=53458 RepID=UPI00082EC268
MASWTAPTPAPGSVPRGQSTLLPLLEHERVGPGHFRGRQPDDDKLQIFGGQALAQALRAATLTVDPAFVPHSMHAYFLVKGDARTPVDFHVEDVRDGRSYVTREVRSSQHGRDILRLVASFHVVEQSFVEHEPPRRLPSHGGMSFVPTPDDVPLLQQWPGFRHPMEIRPVEAQRASVDGAVPTRQMWLRTDGDLGDDPALNACAVAYASDLSLLTTALVPHDLTPGPSGEVSLASLDHSMWFHRPFRGDAWLLHETDSPIAHGGRALTRGAVYDMSGRLVVSTAQEGAVRAPKR